MAGEKNSVGVKVERWRLVKKDAASGRVEEIIEGGDDRPTIRTEYNRNTGSEEENAADR